MTTYVPTPTKKVFNDLMKKLEKQGYRWATEDSPTDYNPSLSKDSAICLEDKEITYGTVGYCKRNGYRLETRFAGKPEPIKYVVAWMEDEDPCEEFTTKKEAEAKIKELLEDEDVVKSSIVLYEIANRWVVEPSFTLKLEK